MGLLKLIPRRKPNCLIDYSAEPFNHEKEKTGEVYWSYSLPLTALMRYELVAHAAHHFDAPL